MHPQQCKHVSRGSTYAQEELTAKSLELQQQLKSLIRRSLMGSATSNAIQADHAAGIVPHKVSQSIKAVQPML